MGFYPDGHPSESTTYTGPTLTLSLRDPQQTKIQGITQEYQEQ